MRTLLAVLLLATFAPAGESFARLPAPEGVSYDAVSIDTAPDGAVWAAWAAFDGRDDDVLCAGYRDGAWSEPITVGDNVNADWQPDVACSPTGDVWVVWSNHRWGDYGIRARCLSGGEWSSESMVTRKRGSFDYAPSVDVASDGTAWVVWESTRDGDTNVYVSQRDRGRWTPPVRLSPSGASDARPSVACTGDGRVWVAWDTVVGGEYRVALSSKEGRTWLEPELLSPAGMHARRPTAMVASDGSLAVVWEGLRKAGPAAEDAYGFDGRVELVPLAECVRVRRNGEWQGLPAAARAAEDEGAAAPGALSGEDRSMYLHYIKERGRGFMRLMAMGGEGGGGFASAAGLPLQVPALALAEGQRLWVGWSSGGRESAVHLRSFTLPGSSDELVRVSGSSPAPAVASERKRETVIRVGLHRYSLLWGDLDGAPAVAGLGLGVDDTCRWARDTRGLDFIAAADHSDPADGYDWKLSTRSAFVFNSDGAFAALPAFTWAREGTGRVGLVYGWHDEDLAHVGASGASAAPWLPVTERMDKLHHAVAVVSPDGGGAGEGGVNWAKLANEGCPAAALAIGDGSHERIAAGLRSAMQRGLRLGLVGGGGESEGSDHSLTAVYAHRLTRASIAEGVALRRCYATNGARIFLDVRVDGRLMGEAWQSVERGHEVWVSAESAAPITGIDVLGASGVLASADPAGVAKVEATLSVETPSGEGEQFLYVRVTDGAGGVAWSSPVFIWPEGAATGVIAPAPPEPPMPAAPVVEREPAPAGGGEAPAPPPAPPPPAAPAAPAAPPARPEAADPGVEYTDTDTERDGFSLQKWLDRRKGEGDEAEEAEEQ